MILADTSVWVAHLRGTERALARSLEAGCILMHPFVLGELACGNVGNRREVLALLAQLPAAPVATHDEAMLYIERHRLMGRGIGWVDVHLLAATALAGTARLWTANGRLKAVAEDLSLSLENS
ncbi:MAG: PIN domain-containing protein [Gemmatimonadetes bacterium]|nr:PIN domain-containing protein [Gemmatimonadota bacterium]